MIMMLIISRQPKYELVEYLSHFDMTSLTSVSANFFCRLVCVGLFCLIDQGPTLYIFRSTFLFIYNRYIHRLNSYMCSCIDYAKDESKYVLLTQEI